MNRRETGFPWKPFARALLGLALTALAINTHAQTTRQDDTPTKTAPADAKNAKLVVQASAPAEQEEVLVLSPFVVTNEAEDTYMARNTLSGNRLVSDVRDLGASISIFTKDFLNDIGAKNAQELLIYAPGMDAGGPGGNYTGAMTDFNNAATNQEVRGQPQISRSRGLASPNYTRGLFTSAIPIDSYNIDSVTVNRGPNAILFGAGSPAGVVDSSLLQAKLNKTETKFETRAGDNESLRNSLDHNQVLIPGRAALRIALLDDHEKFDQRPAYEDKQRLYAALNAKITQSTTIRANIEVGRSTNNKPAQILPFDNITPWVEANKPVWDPSFYDDPARNPGAAARNSGSAQNSDSATLNPLGYGGTFDNNNIFLQPVIAYGNQSDTPTAAFWGWLDATTSSAAAANAVRVDLFHDLVNRDLANDAFIMVNTSNLGLIGSSAYWAAVGGPSNGVRPVGIKLQGFTDYRYFNFAKQQLDTSFLQTEKFNNYNIAIEQLGWKNRLGIELAYNRESYETSYANLWIGVNNSNYVSIDVTKVLPNGQTNPNFGRPMLISRAPSYRDTFIENENKRATAFAKFDFKDINDKLGKWLGSHTLTGLYEEAATEQLVHQRSHVAQSSFVDFRSNFDPIAGGLAMPAFVTYIGNSAIGGPVVLNQNNVAIPEVGLMTPFTYFRAAQGSTVQGNFATEPLVVGMANRGGTATREVIKSQAIVLQSRWLDNHLVTTAGWRRDEDYQAVQAYNYATTSGTYLAGAPTYRQVYYTLNDFAFPDTPPFRVAKETKSWSAVLRWPQKLLRLPDGTGASVFYNSSENFTPAGGRVNVYNQPYESPSGTTKEYGFNLSLLDEKLQLRVAQFETAVEKANLSTQGALANLIINGIGQSFEAWAVEPNFIHVGGPINRSADITKLLSTLPSNYADLYQFKVTTNPTTGMLVASRFQGMLPGAFDTVDYVAKGTEIELTYAPTKQWRFMVNFSKQETKQSNVGPVATEFVERMRPVITALANVPKGNYPDVDASGNPYVLGAALPSNTVTFGQWADVNVYAPYAQLKSSEGVVSPEQPKYRANFVGNFTFSKNSRLAGFNVGLGTRWTSKKAIGYPVSRLANGAIVVDVNKPWWSQEELNIDAWIGYQRRIFHDKVLWKAQINARNIAGDKDPVAIMAQPWGAAAFTRLPAEQRWYLTNTFMF